MLTTTRQLHYPQCMTTKREIAVNALIGLPIWWVGWQILDAMKTCLLHLI